MRWSLHLNHPHIALWRRALARWLLFVAALVVIGWYHSPRLDEVAFVASLPLVLLVPYVVFCLVASLAKALWFQRRQRQHRPRRLRFFRHHRLRDEA